MRRFLILAMLLCCCFALSAFADDQPAPAAAISMSDHGDPVLRAMIAHGNRGCRGDRKSTRLNSSH